MKVKRFNEGSSEFTNYMFFSNIESLSKMLEYIKGLDENKLDSIITDGHDWVSDHLSKSKESVSHVYNFLKSIEDEIK